jgi:hypothetical protein
MKAPIGRFAMSHVARRSYEETSAPVSEHEMKKDMRQRKWRTVQVAISEEDLYRVP